MYDIDLHPLLGADEVRGYFMVAGHYVHVAVEGHGSSSLLFVVKVMVCAVLSLSKLLLYFCFLVLCSTKYEMVSLLQKRKMV
jgi:hypothetical protein